MLLNEIAQRPELIVMVGLPGSGKDHIIQKMIADNPNKQYHIASTDAIIEAIAAEQGKTYSDVFQDVVKPATARMHSEVAQAIRNGENIIWNQTNMAAKKRKGILSQFPRSYVKIAVVVTVDDEVHQQRLKARGESTGKNIPDFVMADMRNNYVEPTTEEGFDKIIHINNTP